MNVHNADRTRILDHEQHRDAALVHQLQRLGRQLETLTFEDYVS